MEKVEREFRQAAELDVCECVFDIGDRLDIGYERR